MARYIALIDGESGGYGVVFPDCPGCGAMGDTMDESLASAAGALREWIEVRAGKGFAAPEARSLDALRNDSEMVEALSEGATSPPYRRWWMPAGRSRRTCRSTPASWRRSTRRPGARIDPVGLPGVGGARQDRERGLV